MIDNLADPIRNVATENLEEPSIFTCLAYWTRTPRLRVIV